MNYVSCIIQIVEISTIELYQNTNIPVVQLQTQLPYLRNKHQSPIIIQSNVWGDLAYDVANYYRVNDYILIEGYLALSFHEQIRQQIITINVTKLYPFLFVL